MPHKLKLVKVLFILKVHLFYLKVVYRRTGFHIRPHVVKLMKVLFNLRVHLFCLKVGCRRTDFHRVHHILKLVKVLFILKVHLFIEKECRRTGFQVRDSTGRHASRKFSLKGPEGKFKFSCRSFQFVYK